MIGVYVANFNLYDTPIPIVPVPGVVYRYFTNTPVTVSGWETHIISLPCPDSVRHSSRYYFDMSCVVMPDCEYTVMFGANSRLVADPRDLVERYLLHSSADSAMFRHPHRDCLYEEAQAVVQMGKEIRVNVEVQVSRYRAEGFPEHFGLFTNIINIRRNTKRMAEFEAAWWEEVKNGSYRDQLAFDYMRWKMKFPIEVIPGDPYVAKDIFVVERHH